MQITDALLRAATTPSPTPTMTVDPNSVSPGPLGFVVMAILVAAVVILLIDMNRRVRRARYRDEINEQLDQEQRGDSAPESGGTGA